MIDLIPIYDFLPCKTPQAWLDEAARPENLPTILTDHLNNELKAAQSAMAIISRYRTGKLAHAKKDQQVTVITPELTLDLLNKMSRLAREELRHYEQVLAIMTKRGIAYDHLGAGRYASMLAAQIRTFEPGKLVDTLIMGGFVEARSCERFVALAPYLDDELKTFYTKLLKSEGRHFEDYITLARAVNGGDIQDRIDAFAAVEKEAIESVDSNFRFHSGVPATAA